jgi:signal transduction histidine kinase
MSGGEQPGVPSPTRTNMAVPVVAPDEDEVANGARDRGSQGDLPDDVGPDRPRSGLPSSVIHELRTPLTSIHGYAQVLQRTLRDEPRAANALAVVVRETTRLSAMLAELSELAELDAGDIVVTPIELEVHQIVDGVVHEIVRRDAGAHPIEIEGSAIARCNPTIMSQVLLHVLTNAVRFSDPGSPIEISVVSRGSQVEITVADRGISVDPADDQRIYEPFERGANARQAGIRGLGLGLFLARSALAHGGGTIRHDPREGGGTVFRITVPGA